MDGFIRDSYCGLYCGACEIMAAYRRSLEAGTRPSWSELPPRFSRHIREADIRCHGCKSDDVFEGCRGCALRDCARRRGVDYCHECAEYPCALVAGMKEAIAKVAEGLPHARAILGNLDSIAKMGKEKWLESQERHWSCEACGAPRTWYEETCRACGASLADKT